MMQGQKIQNAEELEFTVFCIENVAKRLAVGGEEIYQMFTEESDILNEYIVLEYEVLRTQGKEYLVDELLDIMKERKLIS